MADPLVYVDSSEVRPGKLAELKAAIADLAAFVEKNEPRALSYNVYFDAAGGRMTVVHTHPDADSLRTHMRVAGPRFGRFRDLVKLTSIAVFGSVPPNIVDQLRDKARTLGGEVTIQHRYAGFFRS